MKTKLEKITAILGFVNIAFCIFFIITGLYGITSQGAWGLKDKFLLTMVVAKACIVPLVWLIVTIVIQILFIKGKRTASLFMGLLLGAHVFELLIKMKAIMNRPMDYLATMFIYGFLIAGFIVGLITAKKGKAYFILLVISYVIWICMFLFSSLKTSIQLLDPSITIAGNAVLVFLGDFIQPVVLLIAITLFGYYFLFPKKKEA